VSLFNDSSTATTTTLLDDGSKLSTKRFDIIGCLINAVRVAAVEQVRPNDTALVSAQHRQQHPPGVKEAQLDSLHLVRLQVRDYCGNASRHL
jgi:hypothetical protein